MSSNISPLYPRYPPRASSPKVPSTTPSPSRLSASPADRRASPSPSRVGLTKSSPSPSPPNRRLLPWPDWVGPTLMKLPMGITDRASETQPAPPIIDSFEKANRIYSKRIITRTNFTSPPPRPKSNAQSGILKNHASPIARRTAPEPPRKVLFPSPIRFKQSEGKFDDGASSANFRSVSALGAPSRADDAVIEERTALDSHPTPTRGLLPHPDTPRPSKCAFGAASRTDLEFDMRGDLERHAAETASSWRNLSPVERRRQESRMYERMIFETKQTKSKAGAEGASGFSLRI